MSGGDQVLWRRHPHWLKSSSMSRYVLIAYLILLRYCLELTIDIECEACLLENTTNTHRVSHDSTHTSSSLEHSIFPQS